MSPIRYSINIRKGSSKYIQKKNEKTYLRNVLRVSSMIDNK